MNPLPVGTIIPAQYLAYAAAAVTVASALIAVLPPPRNMRTGYAYVWQVLDWIALNFGNGQTTAKGVATGAVVPAPAPQPAARPPMPAPGQGPPARPS